LAYTDYEVIKRRLRLKDDSEKDLITDLQAQAEAEIDLILKRYISVPLVLVPSVIEEIANDLVCGLFHENRTGKPNIFSVRARGLLERYIRETFFDTIVQKPKSELMPSD